MNIGQHLLPWKPFWSIWFAINTLTKSASSHAFLLSQRDVTFIIGSLFQPSSWVFLQDMTTTASFLCFWWAGSSLITSSNKFLSNLRIKSCFLNEIAVTCKNYIALSLYYHLLLYKSVQWIGAFFFLIIISYLFSFRSLVLSSFIFFYATLPSTIL